MEAGLLVHSSRPVGSDRGHLSLGGRGSQPVLLRAGERLEGLDSEFSHGRPSETDKAVGVVVGGCRSPGDFGHREGGDTGNAGWSEGPGSYALGGCS